MAWREIDTREKILSLGTNTSIVTRGNTIGKDLNTKFPDNINIDISNIQCSADVSFIRFINATSFERSIQGNDASFISIGPSDSENLIVVNDASFHKHFQGIGVSFDRIGSENGAFLKFTDDVAFQKSIHGNDVSFDTLDCAVTSDASFHGSMKCVDISLDTIGAIDGQNLVIANDVSFHNNIVGNDLNINVIGNANANNTPIVFRDACFNNSIFAGDVSFNNISSVNTADKLEVSNMTIRHKYKNFIRLGGENDISGVLINSGDAQRSVALSADGYIVAVGDRAYDNNKGRVRVFKYSDLTSSWNIKGNATDMIGGYSEYAGNSVAISADGNVVAVGGRGYLQNKGRVRVFKYVDGSWVLKGGATDMIGANYSDWAGFSVAISADGNIVAVGESDYSGTTGTGRVRVFEYVDSSWVLKGGATDMVGDDSGEEAGNSVALSASGDVVAVGGRGYSGSTGTGRVRVFEYVSSSWVLKGDATDMVGDDNEYAGWSVAISADGNVVAAGSSNYQKVLNYTYGASPNGRARVFEYVSNIDKWVLKGGANDMRGFEEEAGYSVAISADGNIVAVGGRLFSDSLGRVRVFEYSASSDRWIFKHNFIGGYSTALSDYGNILAVGSDKYSDQYSNQDGRVTVLDSSGTGLFTMSDILSKWHDCPRSRRVPRRNVELQLKR